MRKVTLRELENFVALAEQGSVTGAARAIGLSQPAMSTSLRELEKALETDRSLRRRVNELDDALSAKSPNY